MSHHRQTWTHAWPEEKKQAMCLVLVDFRSFQTGWPIGQAPCCVSSLRGEDALGIPGPAAIGVGAVGLLLGMASEDPRAPVLRQVQAVEEPGLCVVSWAGKRQHAVCSSHMHGLLETSASSFVKSPYCGEGSR